MSLYVIKVTPPNTSYGLSLAPLVTLSKFKAPSLHGENPQGTEEGCQTHKGLTLGQNKWQFSKEKFREL